MPRIQVKSLIMAAAAVTAMLLALGAAGGTALAQTPTTQTPTVTPTVATPTNTPVPTSSPTPTVTPATTAAANIQISPSTATNDVRNTHVLTGHVNVEPVGAVAFQNAPDGTTITFAITSGFGSLSASSCVTSGGTGSCSVNLTSGGVAGTTTVSATSTLTVSNTSLTVTTDSTGSNSGPASKLWVDANIQISPTSATNDISQTEVYTGHVNVNPGTGTVNEPDGTTITFAIASGPGTLSPTSCVTSGGTGSCSVNLTSGGAAGTTVINASTSVVVGGITLTRTTDGVSGDSGSATKTWTVGATPSPTTVAPTPTPVRATPTGAQAGASALPRAGQGAPRGGSALPWLFLSLGAAAVLLVSGGLLARRRFAARR